MSEEFGLDVTEAAQIIDTAEVLIVRFHVINKRLLLDMRHNALEGPLLKVVPRVGSVEERFRHLKQLRPRFPVPDRIMSFEWPRQIETMEAAGLWQRIVERMKATGYPEAEKQCRAVWQEILAEQRAETIEAIQGGESYQSLWERAD